MLTQLLSDDVFKENSCILQCLQYIVNEEMIPVPDDLKAKSGSSGKEESDSGSSSSESESSESESDSSDSESDSSNSDSNASESDSYSKDENDPPENENDPPNNENESPENENGTMNNETNSQPTHLAIPAGHTTPSSVSDLPSSPKTEEVKGASE